jgi:hypothetical protein
VQNTLRCIQHLSCTLTSLRMAQLSLSVCMLSRSTLIGPSWGSTAPSATPITSNLPERDTREIQFHSHPKQMRRTDLQHFTVHLLKLHKWMNYIKILQWTCETDTCDTGERKPVWARFTDWDMGADCTSGLGQQLNDFRECSAPHELPLPAV